MKNFCDIIQRRKRKEIGRRESGQQLVLLLTHFAVLNQDISHRSDLSNEARALLSIQTNRSEVSATFFVEVASGKTGME